MVLDNIVAHAQACARFLIVEQTLHPNVVDERKVGVVPPEMPTLIVPIIESRLHVMIKSGCGQRQGILEQGEVEVYTAIDLYISDEYEDVLAEGVWQNTFQVKPEVLTAEEKAAWIAQMSGVTVGSDAFFPFGDNVERAQKSGVQYIAQPGGSIRDDQVIATANKYGMVMAFTGIRLFHH